MNNLPQAFRKVPRTGVIYAMNEARWHGYHPDDPTWANLGQGAPETSALPGSPPRVNQVCFTDADCEYSPVAGLMELREAVAALYNTRYRKGRASQYTAKNVAIVAGGRTALTRVASTLGRTHLGHFLPDYTVYEELLEAFPSFVPMPIMLDPRKRYRFDVDDLEREISGRGLGALLMSNPCNPTGKLVQGKEMEAWVALGRDLDCTLIIDEFYAHYVYGGPDKSVSAASAVDDVNSDPVVILDGLTKNWRYPGWRVAWVVGPEAVIDAVSSAGSFLDGGCARPMQLAALPLLDAAVADAEAAAIQGSFRQKRERMMAGLEALNIPVDLSPEGGFYCWGDLSRLPSDRNNGRSFFLKALQAKVITVPGDFFDIDPGLRRSGRPSRFRHFARFSFGPSMDTVEQGLEGLARAIKS